MAFFLTGWSWIPCWERNWEEAESELQSRTAGLVIEKSGLSKEEIRYSFAGTSGTAHRHFFWKYKSGDPNVRALRSMLTMGEGLGLGACAWRVDLRIMFL